ncbi:MAG: hypothetical protein FIB06_10750 [Betaproteobacteria bacterium]|nr:hypothetical protein [Betaproteobacteria bacterium]
MKQLPRLALSLIAALAFTAAHAADDKPAEAAKPAGEAAEAAKPANGTKATDGAKPAAEAPAPVIVGNPPADHPFGKLKIGMKYEEVIAIVGKPTNQQSWCTGKQHIPFYFGDDKGRAESYFKGMGKLDFNAGVTMLPFRICKGSDPTTLIYVEYNPEATGELPK